MADLSDALVRQAYQRYLEHEETERKYRRFEQAMGATLALIIVLFVAAGYQTVRRNYTLERLAPPLGRELSMLAPHAAQSLSRVLTEVMPVYADVAAKQLPQLLPELESAFSRELDEAWASATAHLHSEVDAALERSARKLQLRLEKEFPGILAEDKGLETLERELLAMLEHDTLEFLDSFSGRYENELRTVYTTLDGFRPNRFEKLDKEELAAHYVHLWLLRLDHELMGTGTR